MTANSAIEVLEKIKNYGFHEVKCLVLFTGPKMFCAGPNFLSQPKNLFTYYASHKHFVPDKRMICIQQNCLLCRHKSFQRGTKRSLIFWLAQKIWTGTKLFWT